MQFDRRMLLRGVGATILGSTALSSVSSAEVSELEAQMSQPDGDYAATNGVHLAADFTEDSQIRGLSDQVRVESAPNPASQGEGLSLGDDVLHITSLPSDDQRPGRGRGRGNDGGSDEDDENGDDGVTFDYGFSIVGVSGRELTVDDLASWEDDEDGAGFSYEWLVTEDNVAGVGTDYERVGVGPDEVWLILREGGPASSDDSGAGLVEDVLAGRLTAVIRELRDDEGTDEWHTRDVAAELGDYSEPYWQGLTVQSGQFEDLGAAPLDEHGDAHVLAVGVGRGDPYRGPSVLDAYYRNLEVAGETYSFPKARRASGPGRGNN